MLGGVQELSFSVVSLAGHCHSQKPLKGLFISSLSVTWGTLSAARKLIVMPVCLWPTETFLGLVY